MTNIDMIQPDLPNVVIGPVISGKKETNADKIRNMTDEELDNFLGNIQWDATNYIIGASKEQEYPYPNNDGAWLSWLKQEA